MTINLPEVTIVENVLSLPQVLICSSAPVEVNLSSVFLIVGGLTLIVGALLHWTNVNSPFSYSREK
jgi:uncharacterized membrane protein YidH (DUF202 family)